MYIVWREKKKDENLRADPRLFSQLQAKPQKNSFVCEYVPVLLTPTSE
jgi:hypothetical protein